MFNLWQLQLAFLQDIKWVFVSVSVYLSLSMYVIIHTATQDLLIITLLFIFS